MSTLVTIAPLLDRLFAESEAHDPASAPQFAAVSAEERQRLMRSKTEYRELYGALADFGLPVSRETGRLLYMLARSTAARSIVEYGTSFGLSTLHLAAALRDTIAAGGGGGRLIGSEFEPSKVARASRNLDAAGLADLVEIREGDALETLARDLPETVDLLLLDGAKGLYADILALIEPRLRPGALIVADNADHCPDYLARVQAPDSGYASVAFAGDVELTMRLD